MKGPWDGTNRRGLARGSGRQENVKSEDACMTPGTYVRVKYLGPDDPLMLMHDKVYVAKTEKYGWFRVVDETDDDYMYPPQLFDVVGAASEAEWHDAMLVVRTYDEPGTPLPDEIVLSGGRRREATDEDGER